MKKNIYFPSSRSEVDSFQVMDILDQTKGMERKGQTIYHLELGEPLNKTPKAVTKCALELLKKKIPGYTPSNGLLELRNKISEFYKNQHNLEISSDQIFITSGSSGAFVLTFLASFDPGKKIGIFNPVYPAYRNILKSLNLEVVEIKNNINNNGKIDVSKLTDYKNLNGLIVSSPNNPTGQIFTKEELKYIYNFCEKNKIVLISDEIYHGIEFDTKTYPMMIFGENAISINSFSKFYCMPGWRLGWAIVPKNFQNNFLKLSQNLFISSSNVGQYSAVKVFDCLKDLNKNVLIYKKNRKILLNVLSNFDVLDFNKPSGSFYFYVNIKQTGLSSKIFAKNLLEETGVAITPGHDFDKLHGGSTVRISFSSESNIIKKAAERIFFWLNKNY